MVDDSREEAKQIRELEGLRVQLESENKTLLGQIGRLQAETKVVRQELERARSEKGTEQLARELESER